MPTAAIKAMPRPAATRVTAFTDLVPSTGPPLAVHSGTIQILLIPSYGMDTGTGLDCHKGGVVFNVDGRGHGSSDLVRKVTTLPKFCKQVGPGGTIEVWSPVPIAL
jgi:hypothetical protein